MVFTAFRSTTTANRHQNRHRNRARVAAESSDWGVRPPDLYRRQVERWVLATARAARLDGTRRAPMPSSVGRMSARRPPAASTVSSRDGFSRPLADLPNGAWVGPVGSS